MLLVDWIVLESSRAGRALENIDTSMDAIYDEDIRRSMFERA